METARWKEKSQDKRHRYGTPILTVKKKKEKTRKKAKKIHKYKTSYMNKDRDKGEEWAVVIAWQIAAEHNEEKDNMNIVACTKVKIRSGGGERD